MQRADPTKRLKGPVKADWLYSIDEASVILGKARSGVFLAIQDGRLDGRKDGRRVRITGQSILEYQASLPRVVVAA